MYILNFTLAVLVLCHARPSESYSARRLFRQWLRSQHENALQPEVEDLTCWTCNNQTDNEACNNWAPDVQCPVGHSVCKAVHRMDMDTTETETITKMCSPPKECSVGCYDVTETGVVARECVTCCTESYCNEDIPTDFLSAITLSLAPFASDSSCIHGIVSYIHVISIFSLVFILIRVV